MYAFSSTLFWKSDAKRPWELQMMPENHHSKLMLYNRKILQMMTENHHWNLMLYYRKILQMMIENHHWNLMLYYRKILQMMVEDHHWNLMLYNRKLVQIFRFKTIIFLCTHFRLRFFGNLMLKDRENYKWCLKTINQILCFIIVNLYKYW